MWKYDSPIGTFYIQQLPDGQYGLLYDGAVWETCDAPETEAEHVFQQSTGCFDWDFYNISHVDVPKDLSEWECC